MRTFLGKGNERSKKKKNLLPALNLFKKLLFSKVCFASSNDICPVTKNNDILETIHIQKADLGDCLCKLLVEVF